MQDIILEAMESGDHALLESRVACETHARLHVFCPMCGHVLDRTTTAVVESRDPSQKVKLLRTLCEARCLKRHRRDIQRWADEQREEGIVYHVDTWAGREML